MDELLMELANILNISTEGLLGAYPTIREQYISSYIASELYTYIGFILAGFIFIGGLMILFTETYGMSDDEYSDFKAGIVFYILTLIIMSTLRICLNYRIIRLAPDLMLLREFL